MYVAATVCCGNSIVNGTLSHTVPYQRRCRNIKYVQLGGDSYSYSWGPTREQ